MTAGAPWSVKGIDPKAREVAKDLARRSGMTLGEWLNRVILEDDVPEDVTSEDHFTDRTVRPFESRPRLVASAGLNAAGSRADDLSRIAYALDRLTDRIESSETRTSLAISGVEHSVRAAVARIEAGEREHLAVAARLDAEQARSGERLRRLEAEPAGPRSAEALALIEARLGRVEGLGGGDPAPLIDEVVRRLGERLADAEGRTAGALESLRGALAALDRRLGAVEGGDEAERRLEALAAGLTERVEAARAEIAERLAATESGRIDERFAELASQVEAAERRSAQAVERMGRELIGVAEAFNRRLQTSEVRSAKAIADIGGEMARIAGAVEQRLSRTETAQADALDKLGAEIGRITERLTDRMQQSERRAAQAIDDVGDQVARVTERIEQRHERISNDLAERLRESEARTARLLEDAAERLQPRAPAAPEADAPITGAAAFGPELFSRAESLEPAAPFMPARIEPARIESARAEPAPIDADFAPIPEPEEDVFGLEAPAPPATEAPLGARPLSTREVIDQARAAARAADGGRPRMQVKARANWRAAPKPQFGKPQAAKPATRSSRAAGSTLQTAFMIAGGAAFLSVGAAGMVLMNANSGQDVVEASPFETPPRAAVAIAPQPLSALAPGAQAPAGAEAPAGAPAAPQAAAPAQPLSAQYLTTLRQLEDGEPGALARMKSLAEADYAPAQFYMSKLYETGAHGAVKNAAEARRWAARSAVNGEARGMHNLALYYFEGAGGPQDLAGAARWFRKAAELGVGDSQYNLGLLHQAGSGVPRDLTEAYKWFTIAAAGGDAAARSSAVDLEKKLTPAQLAAADKAAAEFRPQGQLAAGRGPAVSLAAAQRILGRLGYYKGQPSGAASREFSLAVAAYQRDQGLAATGALDPNTTQRLSVFTR
ncbi:peptidoglycan-binding protein [Phenylobacterium sp.]|jgi:localization factor PodJL|uniref:peptidoglycan-binding protein n=1 Tax=Phenylobacterium sp. TaxID=1871053 RepID=UPI0037841DDC